MRRSGQVRAAVPLAALAVLVACGEAPEVTGVGPEIPRPRFAVLLGTETRITEPTGGQQWLPAISGTRVVWADLRHGNYDIYMYDIATGVETRLTTDPEDQLFPAISGDRVVWRDHRNGNWDVYLHDLSTGMERQITSAPTSENSPDISGDRIVWSDVRNGSDDIYMYDLATDTERRITTSPGLELEPAITGDRIVWTDDRNGPGNWDLYIFDLATNTESRVATEPGTQQQPRISGDWIAFRDHPGDPARPLALVSAFNLATNTQVPIISGPGAHGIAPDVSGLRVVWEDRREGFSRIYLHDHATGEEFQITSGPATAKDPRISGNRIVWNDYRDDPTGDIFLFEIATTPVACIAAVRARLDEYVTGGGVANAGIAESLRALLDQAESAAGRGDVTAAGNVLRAFIRHVEAQSGRHVDPAAATTLAEMAEAAIGCL